jgi:hypothetical protein
MVIGHDKDDIGPFLCNFLIIRFAGYQTQKYYTKDDAKS